MKAKTQEETNEGQDGQQQTPQLPAEEVKATYNEWQDTASVATQPTEEANSNSATNNDSHKSPKKQKAGKSQGSNQRTQETDSAQRKKSQHDQAYAHMMQAPGNSHHLAQMNTREQEQVLSHAAIQRKEFRVFFGVIDTSEDAHSPAQKLDRFRGLPADDSGKKKKATSDQELADELKAWFSNLTIDERINVLTTSCPHWAQTLVQMRQTIIKQGPTLFAKRDQTPQNQAAQKLAYQQQLMRDYNQAFRHQHMLNAVSYQPFGHTYFGGPHPIYHSSNQMMRYQMPEVYGQPPYYEVDEQAAVMGEEVENRSFENEFITSIQSKHEVEQMRAELPGRHEAWQKLCQHIRLTDLVMYLDSISVAPDLVADVNSFFDVMNRATDSQAFCQPCKFKAETKENGKMGMSIESPSWFQPSGFSSFGTWIAVLLEENLWANYNYWLLCSKKVNPKALVNPVQSTEKNQNEKKNVSWTNCISQLFEQSDIQDSLQLNLPTTKVHGLAMSWLKADSNTKLTIFESMRSILVNRTSSQGLDSGETNIIQGGGSPLYVLSSADWQNAQPNQLHIFNESFDSHYHALIIRRDEYESIEQMALNVAETSIESFKGGILKDFTGSLIQSDDDSGSNASQSTNKFNLQKLNPEMSEQEATQAKKSPRREPTAAQYELAIRFIIFLLQSSLDRVETGKDYVCRTFLKFIQQMHEDQVISELLGGNDKQLESGLDATDEPTPNKKKKKRRNNRQNAQETDKQATASKEIETTPLQSIEDSVDVMDSKNNSALTEERKARELSEGTGSDGNSKNESKQPKIEICDVEDQNQTERKSDTNSAGKDQAKNSRKMETEKLQQLMDIKQTNEENAQKNVSEVTEEENKEPAASDKEVQQSVSSAYVADMFTRLEINQATPQGDEQPKKKSKKKKKNNRVNSSAVTTNAEESKDDLTKSNSVVFNSNNEDVLKGSPLTPEKQRSVIVSHRDSLQLSKGSSTGQGSAQTQKNKDNKGNQPAASGEESKRRRKKTKKGAVDPQEAMNAFIRELNSKAEKKQAEMNAHQNRQKDRRPPTANKRKDDDSTSTISRDTEGLRKQQPQRKQKREPQHPQQPQHSQRAQKTNKPKEELGAKERERIKSQKTRKDVVDAFDQWESMLNPGDKQESAESQEKPQAEAEEKKGLADKPKSSEVAPEKPVIKRLQTQTVSYEDRPELPNLNQNVTAQPQAFHHEAQQFANQERMEAEANAYYDETARMQQMQQPAHPSFQQIPAIQQTFNNIYLNSNPQYGQIGQGLLPGEQDFQFQYGHNIGGHMMPQPQSSYGLPPNLLMQNPIQKHHSMPAAPYRNYAPASNFEQNIKQQIEFKFYEKFDNDIYDEVNKIQRDLDLAKDERKYVLAKLQDMCNECFPKVQPQFNQNQGSPGRRQMGSPRIKQFGSLVTGLALESSDMDMAVTNLYLPDRESMLESLQLFADKLRQWKMIENLKDIPTATIPVIKAIVDLNKLREEMPLDLGPNADKNDFGATQGTLDGKLASQGRQPLPDKISLLKIDITFDDSLEDQDLPLTIGEQGNSYEMQAGFTSPHHFLARQQPQQLHEMHRQQQVPGLANILEQKTHLGIASCRLISTYVESYKCLKEVAIILKTFLARHNYNSPYLGGISSYSTVLLLVAYMNKWNMRLNPTLTPSRLLMGFLDYFSHFFNVQNFGIDVSNEGSFFKHSSPETNLVILDPLNVANNTAKNSFLTYNILKQFRAAFNALKDLLLQYQAQMNANIDHNLVDIMLERFQTCELDPEEEQKSGGSADSQRLKTTQETQTDEAIPVACAQEGQ